MANQVTGRLLAIGQTVQLQSKTGSTFKKREFLLDATTHDPYTGERNPYENILPLELSEDKCAELDRFQVGDIVTVSFALQGRQWQTQDGETKRMVGIRCYKLEKRTTQQQAPQPTPQFAPAPQPSPAPHSVPTMEQSFPPQIDAAGNPKDDLPF